MEKRGIKCRHTTSTGEKERKNLYLPLKTPEDKRPVSCTGGKVTAAATASVAAAAAAAVAAGFVPAAAPPSPSVRSVHIFYPRAFPELNSE